MVEPIKFSSLGIVPDVIIGDKIPINDILTTKLEEVK